MTCQTERSYPIIGSINCHKNLVKHKTINQDIVAVIGQVTHCLPLPIIPSIHPVCVKFSEFSLLIMCHSDLNYTSLILTISVVLVLFFFKTSSLFYCPVPDILSICLQKDISVASSVTFIKKFVYYSLSYRRIIQLFISFSLFLTKVFYCLIIWLVFGKPLS